MFYLSTELMVRELPGWMGQSQSGESSRAESQSTQSSLLQS